MTNRISTTVYGSSGIPLYVEHKDAPQIDNKAPPKSQDVCPVRPVLFSVNGGRTGTPQPHRYGQHPTRPLDRCSDCGDVRWTNDEAAAKRRLRAEVIAGLPR